MSLRFSKVTRRMWGDAKFASLSAPQPNAQSLFVYMLTCPELTALPGVLLASEGLLADATGWPVESLRKAFREVSAKGMAKADWKARVVFLPNAVRHNAPESPNVVVGWRRVFDELPDTPLKVDIYQAFEAQCASMSDGYREAFRKAFGSLSEGFADPSPNQEQEQEQEQEQDSFARALVLAADVLANAAEAEPRHARTEENPNHIAFKAENSSIAMQSAALTAPRKSNVNFLAAIDHVPPMPIAEPQRPIRRPGYEDPRLSRDQLAKSFSEARKAAGGGPSGSRLAMRLYDPGMQAIDLFCSEADERGVEPLGLVTLSAANFCADPWAAEHNFPIAAWLADPGKYLARPATVADMRARIATLETQSEEAYRNGNRTEFDRLNAEWEQLSAQLKERTRKSVSARA